MMHKHPSFRFDSDPKRGPAMRDTHPLRGAHFDGLISHIDKPPARPQAGGVHDQRERRRRHLGDKG